MRLFHAYRRPHLGDAGFPGALFGGHDGRVEQAFFATFEQVALRPAG